MSTYVYLVCLDHTPPLRAQEESGQHLSDLARLRREVADREALVNAYENGTLRHYRATLDIDDYFTRNSVSFLAQHKTCRLGIEDETGRKHPIEDDEQ